MMSDDLLVDIERYIYLPILLIVLEKDEKYFEQGPFKLKSPYINMLLSIRKKIEADFIEVKQKLKTKGVKVVRGERDELFTEYYFYIGKFVDKRRYSNVRLKNFSETLLEEYIQNCKPNVE